MIFLWWIDLSLCEHKEVQFFFTHSRWKWTEVRSVVDSELSGFVVNMWGINVHLSQFQKVFSVWRIHSILSTTIKISRLKNPFCYILTSESVTNTLLWCPCLTWNPLSSEAQYLLLLDPSCHYTLHVKSPTENESQGTCFLLLILFLF